MTEFCPPIAKSIHDNTALVLIKCMEPQVKVRMRGIDTTHLFKMPLTIIMCHFLNRDGIPIPSETNLCRTIDITITYKKVACHTRNVLVEMVVVLYLILRG